MFSPSARNLILGLGACLSLTAAGTHLAIRLQRWQPHGYASRATELIYLPTPAQARILALGYREVVADYYWVRALQYFTEPSLAVVSYKNLADFLEVVVGVDPDFEYAYKFAGIAIPFDVGRGRFVNTERSTSLLERGVERFPNNWQLRFFLGFNYLNYHQQPAKAAEQFAAASKLPGAPRYLSAFTAKVFTVGGDIERAISFAETTLETAEDPEVQSLMKKRLRDLYAEKMVGRIEEGAQRFREQLGRYPFDLDELVRSGFPPPPPGFVLNADGKAQPPAEFRRMILHVPHEERGNEGSRADGQGN